MLQLLLGLVLFLGMHSVSIFAVSLRDTCATKSEIGWKVFYSGVSLIGLILIFRGYADAKQASTLLYVAPAWLYSVAGIVLLPTFVLLFAPYFPGRISKAVKHPQLIAVMIWAVAHLLVNGTLADVIVFVSFLLWAIADLNSMKKRAPRPIPGAAESKANDIILIVAGLGLYLATVFWFHEILLGVRPFA